MCHSSKHLNRCIIRTMVINLKFRINFSHSVRSYQGKVYFNLLESSSFSFHWFLFSINQLASVYCLYILKLIWCHMIALLLSHIYNTKFWKIAAQKHFGGKTLVGWLLCAANKLRWKLLSEKIWQTGVVDCQISVPSFLLPKFHAIQ